MPTPELTRWRWIGLAGTVAMAVGAVGAGVLPAEDLPLAGEWRESPWWRICAVGVVVGLAVVTLAWWRLRRVTSVRSLTITTLVWSVPLALAPPLFSRDAYSYAVQGALLGAGMDPYHEGVRDLDSAWVDSVSRAWLDTPAPYGPLFLLLARWAAWASNGNLLVALLLLRLLAVVGVVLVAVYLPRLAAACGTDPARAQWFGLAGPMVLIHCVAGLHNDALMVGLLVAGLAFAAKKYGLLAAVAIGLAAAVKAPAAVALPFAALLYAGANRRAGSLVRAMAATVAVAGVTFALVTLAAGLDLGWLAAISSSGSSVQWTSLPSGLGAAAGWIAGVAGRGDLTDELLAGARLAGSVATVIVLVVLFLSTTKHDTRRIVATTAVAFGVVAWLAAAFHPWYALWGLVLAAAVLPPERTVRWRVLIGVTLLLTFLVLPSGYNLARSTTVPGVLLDVALTGGMVALALRWVRGRRRPATVVPATEPERIRR